MQSLEKKVRNLAFMMLSCGILLVCLVLYLSSIYVLKKEKMYYLLTAKNKIYSIEQEVQSFLQTYVTMTEYIKNDKHFKSLYTSGVEKLNENICLIRMMKKNKHIQSIGFIDFNNRFSFKFEKDIYNIILTNYDGKSKRNDNYIEEDKKTKTTIFTPIYSVDFFQNPIATIFSPVFNNEGKIIGLFFSDFDVSNFLNKTIN